MTDETDIGYYRMHSKLFAACLREYNTYVQAVQFYVVKYPDKPCSELHHAARRLSLIRELMYLERAPVDKPEEPQMADKPTLKIAELPDAEPDDNPYAYTEEAEFDSDEPVRDALVSLGLWTWQVFGALGGFALLVAIGAIVMLALGLLSKLIDG